MFNGGLHNWSAKPVNTVNDEGKNLNSLVAQSNPTNTDVSEAKVVFTGNQAWRHPYYTQTVSGGAIGCNGLLEIGTSTEIKIVKLWDDKDNTSNRPSKNDFLKSVKILADGEEIDKDGLLIDVITKDVEKYVLYNNIANEDGEPVDFGDKEPWLIIVSGLPKYSDEDGELEIKYTIKEDDIANYKLVKNEGDMETYFELENKIELIEIPVDKIWDDKNDDAVLRPNSVDVKLFADGEDTGKVITLKKDNNWKGKFEKLLKYDGEREIEYSVEEVMEGYLEYYMAEISGNAKDGFTITNKLEVLSDVEATGVKNWVGDKKADRPKSITIQLLENGTPLEDVILEVVPDENGDWEYCFSGMPRYKNGEEIEYSVKELNVPKGYRAESDGFNLTNTYMGTKPKSSGKGANTGDNNPTVALIAILAVCAAAIAGIIIKRRKQR
jgi:LPXTG-motif cell wall-anchored protein